MNKEKRKTKKKKKKKRCLALIYLHQNKSRSSKTSSALLRLRGARARRRLIILQQVPPFKWLETSLDLHSHVIYPKDMQNVEAEAAKFLQKLIQESKDEPGKLAKKLYVILQHMKESGKENTMPFQVISRAMETVINEHCLDIDAIKSSRLPISGGSQIGDSSRAQSAGCSQAAGVAKESKTGLMQSDLGRADVLCSTLPLAGPSGAGHDPYQISVSHRCGKSFNHESPSSLDTRSANSHSSDRRDRGSWEQQGNQKETKKSTTKRRRSDSTSGIESHMDNIQQMEAYSMEADMRQGNMINEAEMLGSFAEENLLIINRLHQVLRPFVLRRLKHKVENELPEKIERLIRCEASAYQKLLMKRVEDNLGSLGGSKVRSVQNSVIELRNICNHPYLSQLHTDEVDALIPKHFLPPIVRLCGKLEMLDRLLPKLKVTNHRVLFFSTMTRLLDVMEECLLWKKYRYLRLDGQTSGNDRGAIIEKFNHPESPFFIFLLSIRAGGVGVNLQAADTVIIFDTDWNPQVDLQAQARAHRIGQKKDVLVLRLETVNTVEEQLRAAAEHKLGVANQSITAGFFYNNTSAEDRRQYLESLLRECKKEVAAPVLNDDGLNYLLARSESEIDIFESIDRKRQEEEMEVWKTMLVEQRICGSDHIPPLPLRLVTDEDLKPFYEAMKIHEVPSGEMSNVGIKRKSNYLGGFDAQQYGWGKRAREVRSYEEQWSEEEFEKLCHVDSSETLKPKQVLKDALLSITCGSVGISPLTQEVTPPVKRGRGRPRRVPLVASPSSVGHPLTIGLNSQVLCGSTDAVRSTPDPCPRPALAQNDIGTSQQVAVKIASELQATPLTPSLFADPSTSILPSVASQPAGKNSKGKGSDTGRRRGRKLYKNSPSIHTSPVVESSAGSEPVNSAPLTITNGLAVQNPQSSELPAKDALSAVPPSDLAVQNFLSAQKLKETLLSTPDLAIGNPESVVRAIKNASPSALSEGNSQEATSSGNVVYGDSDPCPCPVIDNSSGATQQVNVEMVHNFQTTSPLTIDPCIPSPKENGTAEMGHRRGKKSNKSSPSLSVGLADEKPQSSKLPVKDASPSACAGLVVHTLSSSEHLMTENLPLVPADTTIRNPEFSKQVVKQAASSGSAGLVFQGSQCAFQPVEQACPTDHSRLAVNNSETSKQVSMRATPSTVSSLGIQEPKSRKRKIIPPSSDMPSGPVIPSILVKASLASVSQSSVDPSAAVGHGGTPHFGLPSYSSEVASDSHGMPATISSPKSQSGAEPARRRGRKPALLARTASTVSVVQDPKTYEPSKDAASNVVSSSLFPGSHGTANIGMGSQTVALPIVPLVPVSGLVPGAISVKDATGSVHRLSVSFAPSFPSTQQTVPVLSATSSSQPDPAMKAKGSKPRSSSGEATLHRRARKTAPVTAAGPLSLTDQDSSLRQMVAIDNDNIEGKGVEQRLEKHSLESIKAQEVHRVCDPVSSPVKEPRTNEDESSSEIQQPKVVSLGRSSISNECVTMKINEGVKARDSRNDSSTAEPPFSSCIANMETSGSPDHKATIVLALKSALPTVHSINSKIINKLGSEGSLDYQKEDAEPERFGVLETQVSELVGNFTSEIAVICHLDEDMSVPSGFNTPRSHVNALVGTSLGSEDAKFHGKAFLPREERCLPGKTLLVGATDNLMDPDHLVDEDRVPPGFGSKADVMRTVGPNDGGDSSALVDEDSVPPGFEPQTCKGKEKNEAAEILISKVPVEGDVGQNLMENSHETSLDVPTAVIVEGPVDKCSEQVEDNYGIQESNDRVQAEDLRSGPEVDVCKAGTGVDSSSFVENLRPCSKANVRTSVSGKNDCSSKIPTYSPHLPDASITIELEKTSNKSSFDSFVGGTESKIITSPSVAESDGVVDVSIEVSQDSISNSNTVSCNLAVEASLNLVSGSMHEQESHDLDVGKLKGEVASASCLLTGESEGTVGLNQKGFSVGEWMSGTSSLETVAEQVQPVLRNPITEVNIEASLKPEVREEGHIIAESLSESILESRDQPINEEQSTKQQEGYADVSIMTDEDACADGSISVRDSCYNGSIQEGSLGEDTAKPQSNIESATHQLDPILSSTQSTHDQKEASQRAMQPLHSTKIIPIIEIFGADTEQSANAAITLVPEVYNKEEMITSSCSGNTEFPLCPMIEASAIPADTVASDLASGDDQMVEGECSVLPTLDTSANTTNMDPTFGASTDGYGAEAECSAQAKLEIPSNSTYMEPSLFVPCDSSAMEPECSMQPISETTADPNNVERSHCVSDDVHVKAKDSLRPVFKILTNAADLEPSHAISGDDQMVKIKCSKKTIEEYYTDPADLELSQAASDDDQMVEAEPSIQQIQQLFTDPVFIEHPEALSGNVKIVGAEFSMQPVSESSTGLSQAVSEDHEMVGLEGSTQQISERSTDPFAIEQSDVISGDDRIAEAECSMEPILESSTHQTESFSDCDQTVEAKCSIQQLSSDPAVIEQLDAISGDDKIVVAECSKPTSKCSTGTANIPVTALELLSVLNVLMTLLLTSPALLLTCQMIKYRIRMIVISPFGLKVWSLWLMHLIV